MAPCDLGLKTVADLAAKAGDLRIASEYIVNNHPILHRWRSGQWRHVL
ncbi:MAG: hypothetical protein ACI9BH_002672 [Paracoccaceae bacterium]|jgi:hypothetical protein